MLVTKLKEEFYELLLGKHVLLVVNLDTDALCACKILQFLFKCDDVSYSVIPVGRYSELKTAVVENGEAFNHIIFINCGGTMNVLELLDLSDDVLIFIADSHRPIDVYNIYSASQVRVLMKIDDDDTTIPQFQDVFGNDDDEEEDDVNDNELSDDNEESEPASKRSRFDENTILKRREKRLWEEARDKILFEYTEYNYIGKSTAVLMFELSFELSKENNDILWWACVGLTEQYVNGKIDKSKFLMECGNLRGHVTRLNHRDSDTNPSVQALKIKFEQELQLVLYRHWSLYESMKHTLHTACRFQLWTVAGESKLSIFLAELGLPVRNCRQLFSSMDMNQRNNVQTWIETMVDKYNLDQIIFGSFSAQFGFRNKYTASDVAFATTALLDKCYDCEENSNGVTEKNLFFTALDCLSRNEHGLENLQKGIGVAKVQMIAMMQQVQSILHTKCLYSQGPFILLEIPEGTENKEIIFQPTSIVALARHVLHAHNTMFASRRVRNRQTATNLPLVVVAPLAKDMLLVAGIPSVAQDTPRNLFGKAFAQALLQSRSHAVCDYFDNSVIQVKTEDRSKFIGTLISLFQ